MKILYVYKESETTEKHIVTEVESDNGERFDIASYIYNGRLAEDETAPTYMCSKEFEDNLTEIERIEIIKAVNIEVKSSAKDL